MVNPSTSSGPLVSVVLIFLNAERFIGEAIESVLAQTWNDWELMLVDDGSTDGSSALARAYAEKWAPRVRYLEHSGHQNLGVSASRNLGIRESGGAFVAFIDSDDAWLPEKLERQLSILGTFPEAALVYGRDLYWHSWDGNAEKGDLLPKLGVHSEKLLPPPGLLARFLLGSAAIPCPTNIMVRRSALERVGGFVESFTGIHMVQEDQAFYSKLLLKESAVAVDDCWNWYRQHAHSNVSVDRSSGRARETRAYFLNWLEAYLHESEFQSPVIWKALRKAQWRLRHPIIARLRRQISRRLRTRLV